MSFDDVFYIETLHSEKVKMVASEIGNETGCRILKELYKNPSSISELSEKLKIPMPTVQYHIGKLIELGIVKVAHRKLGKRLQNVKLYTFDKEGIIIASTEKNKFEHILRAYLSHMLKSPLVLVLLFVGCLVTTLIGGSILEHKIYESMQQISEEWYPVGKFKLDTGLLQLFIAVSFLLGVAFSILVIAATMKIKIKKTKR